MHRGSQSPQHGVILWGYRLFLGALLVQLGSRTYHFRAYHRAVASHVWEGEGLVRRTSEAMPVGINHQFKTISHSQLGKDGREVVSYRRLTDAQALGDLFIP
jgi:hypothetical protein